MRPLAISIFLFSVAVLPAQAQLPTLVISKKEQKARDDGRREILEAELTAETKALEQARNAPPDSASGDRDAAIHRHEENIKALKRELSGATSASGDGERQRVVVKAVRVASRSTGSESAPKFWDPYNRAPDTSDFLNQR